MDIGEAVAVTLGGMQSKKEKFCGSNPKTPPTWTARVDGHGATPTAKQLASNMQKASHNPPDLPNRSKGKYDLFDCRKGRHPWQCHHLIPKKHLPSHKVCVWLTAKWKKDAKYVLEKDAPFDTDGERNGYFMPFASSTAQWKAARGDEPEQKLVCYEMMRRVGIQLHQGSHAAEKLGEDVDDIETYGYLDFVDALLDVVYDETLKHVATCDTCKQSSSGGKIKVAPIETVAKHVYGVAQTTKTAIDANYIFVSERADQYFRETLGTPPTTPYLTP